MSGLTYAHVNQLADRTLQRLLSQKGSLQTKAGDKPN